MKTTAIAYPPWARVVASILVAISRGSLVVLVALLFFFETRLTNQLRLMRAFATYCLVPGFAAWMLERAFAVTLEIRDGTLVLDQPGRRVEIPCDAIVRVDPWTVPLPSGGLWLRLESGRRFDYGVQVDDPVALIDALADAGASAAIRAASRHRAAVYARSKHATSRRWYQPVLAFVVFGLVPTVPLFRLHQWVAYGGTFGEYYSYGLTAYLLAFAIYWATYVIYLILYAAILRAVVEAFALVATAIAPSRARTVRRTVEIADRVLYFGGVITLLGKLFLTS